MTETSSSDNDGKKLELNKPKKLELNKTIESGQIRQSFSHGRSKMVQVEVRKKRSFARDAEGKMSAVQEEAGAAEVAVAKPVFKETTSTSNLTNEEKPTAPRSSKPPRLKQKHVLLKMPRLRKNKSSPMRHALLKKL